MRRRQLIVSLGALAAAGLFRAGRAHEGHHAPPEPGYTRSVAAYGVPDTALVDMHGAPLALGQALAGPEPLLMNFIFTTCTAICPVMTSVFAQVQERLAMDRSPVRLVSISIDPEHDTPARLLAYARRFGAGPRWRFLTGSASASLEVQKAFDVYRGDKMGHDPVTFLHAPGARAWVRLDGFARAAELVQEYHRLAHG